MADKATFAQGDLFEADLSKATVITLFLLPTINLKLRPSLLELKPGTRIVSNTFDMGDWQSDAEATSEACTSWCKALLWVVPAKVAGTWRLGDQTLTLTQQYQIVGGTLGSTPIDDRQAEGRCPHLHGRRPDLRGACERRPHHGLGLVGDQGARTRVRAPMIRIGVDTGGTFTDLVRFGPEGVSVHKVRSTPDDPSRAIVAGIADVAAAGTGLDVVHGSTVATNAVLERRGARVALVATAGFEDVVRIGRQTRRALYDLMQEDRRPAGRSRAHDRRPRAARRGRAAADPARRRRDRARRRRTSARPAPPPPRSACSTPTGTPPTKSGSRRPWRRPGSTSRCPRACCASIASTSAGARRSSTPT